jgi:DNA-binding NarL/FixJ family response regulator
MIDILIADADPAARKSLSLLLRRKLCMEDIYEVADLESLIHILANTPPEILLLDGKLCSIPPFEICRLIQRALPHLNIVLLSLDANDEQIAKDVGVDFIHKGAAPETIISKLISLLYKDSLNFTNS